MISSNPSHYIQGNIGFKMLRPQRCMKHQRSPNSILYSIHISYGENFRIKDLLLLSLYMKICPISLGVFKHTKLSESLSRCPWTSTFIKCKQIQLQTLKRPRHRMLQLCCTVYISGKWTWYYFPPRNHQFTHLFSAAVDIITTMLFIGTRPSEGALVKHL